MQLLDLSKPWLMEKGAMRSHLAIYRQTLERQAAGQLLVPDRKPDEREGTVATGGRLAKNIDKRGGERMPTGLVNRWGEPTYYAWTIRDGVATIDVIGPIMRYADWFWSYFGWTSTEGIARHFDEAVNHPDVRAIILNIDSPGGEAAGIGELAEQINAGQQQKRVVAYGDSLVCSAAYWLGSACEEIVLSPSGSAGSIGTIMAWLDDSKFLDRMGFEEIEFISSQSPLKNPDPKSKAGKNEYQRLVNDMTDVFGAAVAKYRGVSVETVFGSYGRGGIMVGDRAVAAGMVDRLGDYESLLAELARRGARGQQSTLGAVRRAVSQRPTVKPAATTRLKGAKMADEHEDIVPGEETDDLDAENTDDTTDVDDIDTGEAEDGNGETDDETGDGDVSAGVDAGASEVAKLRAELAKTQQKLQQQEAALKQNRVASAQAARDKFKSSLAGKVAPAAREPLTALFGALQKGKATTAQLESAVAALPKSEMLDDIDADVDNLTEVAPPKAADPHAADVKAAEEMAEAENERRRKGGK